MVILGLNNTVKKRVDLAAKALANFLNIRVFGISIPDFSRRFATFFPGPQIAPVGISDPTVSSRSDLWYVPTLRTFLLYCAYSRTMGLTRSHKEPYF